MIPYWLVGAMSVVLFVAVYFDHRQRRIPNRLVLAGLGVALLLHAFPFVSAGQLQVPVFGALLGLALFLPLYLLGIVGAGDVKLVAVVGGFVGADQIVPTILAILVAGGGLAVVRMFWMNASGKVLANLLAIASDWRPGSSAQRQRNFVVARDTADRMPYAYAVMIGAIGYQIFSRLTL